MRLRRAALAAAGIAAGALAGCQTPGTQYMHTGVARGDMVPASPALARAGAGQQFARCGSSCMTPGQTTTAVIQDPTMTAGAPAMQAVIAGPGIAGSGGMVYPINYAPVPSQPMMSGQVVMQQPMMIPAQPQPATMPMQQQAMPMQQAMPAPSGQQTLLLVNGPNGPQYMIAEVIGQVQTQPAAPVMTAPSMPAPAMTAPVAYTQQVPTQPMMMPAPTPAPPAPAPAAEVVAPSAPVFATAPAPAAPPAAVPPPMSSPPTFNPPPPAAIPMPAIPPLPPASETSLKTPAPLPSTMNSTASAGPVLPAPDPAMPTLASYPIPPVKSTGPGPKLPRPTAVTDDDIPAAPVFVPAPR